jgi:flagellar protein FlbD
VIKLTKIDGHEIHINHCNIQWIETLPDTTVTILSGARIIVKESLNDVLRLIDERINYENSFCLNKDFTISHSNSDKLPHMT